MCDNKVNILDKWSPSANLSRNSQCGDCLKFNVTIIDKPDINVTIIISSIIIGPTNFSISSLFYNKNNVQTGQLCRSSVKNNTVYLTNIQNPENIIQYKINDTQCVYDVEFKYVAPP
jgi:hypothetical protein